MNQIGLGLGAVLLTLCLGLLLSTPMPGLGRQQDGKRMQPAHNYSVTRSLGHSRGPQVSWWWWWYRR